MIWTEEQILAIDPRFQKLIDVVKLNNTSGTFKYWHELWPTIKNMNDQFGICGFRAKDIRLVGSDVYESMARILENYTTLK